MMVATFHFGRSLSCDKGREPAYELRNFPHGLLEFVEGTHILVAQDLLEKTVSTAIKGQPWGSFPLHG